MPVTGHLPPRPPLDRDRLAAPLGDGAGPPWRVEVYDESTSTNAVVAEEARAGAPEGLVVVAEHQTAGRGRLDRTWVTPARSALTFSVLLRPQAEPARWPWLPLLTGVAVQGAIGSGSRLKWPNDVLLGDHKVAGILLERVETGTGPAAVVGVGINVSTTLGELPVPTATSLAIAGHEVDRTDLLLAVLDGFGRRYATWNHAPRHDAGEDALLQAAYQRVCATIGQLVRVDLPGEESITGTAVDVDLSGRLVVRTAGETVAVVAGDVVHVRPAG